MVGNFELRTKYQFAGLVERRDRLNGFRDDAGAQNRFAQLIGHTWARENCALDEVGKTSSWLQGTLGEKRALQLNHHVSAAQWFSNCSLSQASLSCANLLELHHRLIEGIHPLAGRFRESEISSFGEGHEPIEAELVPYVVENALEWFSSDSFHEMHEVEKTALILMKLVDIWPFEEGNGLTLRLFANFFLLKSGYPPAILPSTKAPQYAAAIQNSFRFHTQPLIDLLTEAVLQGLLYCLAEPAGPPRLDIVG
jgi:Fic family protein